MANEIEIKALTENLQEVISFDQISITLIDKGKRGKNICGLL